MVKGSLIIDDPISVTKPDMKEVWIALDKWFQALPQDEKDRITKDIQQRVGLELSLCEKMIKTG